MTPSGSRVPTSVEIISRLTPVFAFEHFSGNSVHPARERLPERLGSVFFAEIVFKNLPRIFLQGHATGARFSLERHKFIFR